MSAAISAPNCVRRALVGLGNLGSEELDNTSQTIMDVWSKASAEILKKISEDPAAREFAAKNFIEFNLDGFSKDCQGLKRCPCTQRAFHSETGFSSLISHMNPAWNGASKVTEEEHLDAMKKAVEFVSEEILSRLKYHANDIYLGYATVQEAIEKTYNPESKSIFLSRFVPWRDHIYDLEAAAGVTVNWVVFQDDRSLQWRCTSVSDKTSRFTNRALLAPSLRGLQGKDIAEKIKYTGDGDTNQFFVHHSGFTSGAPTKEAMLIVLNYAD